jgi:predicted ArsR family transcriptional regulator
VRVEAILADKNSIWSNLMALKSTRQRILDLLLIQDQVNAAEISRVLSITQADVRYHLSRMVAEGLILVVKPKYTGRRGRPARRYSLASKSKQNNFDILTRALLLTMRERNAEEERNQFIHDIALKIPGGFKPGGPLGKRLVQAVDQLNLQNYQARWEAHANAPRVIFERCPFASLRPEFPELCNLDTTLLAIFLDEKVIQVESNAHLSDGFCQFNISPKTVAGG